MGKEIEIWLSSALEVAIEAGDIIKTAMVAKKQIKTKENPADLVTLTDQKVEEFLFKKLSERYPFHEFIGEESVSETKERTNELQDKPTWIIDPVDGTTNFVHGFPFFCVSIGLTFNKEAVVGVVYNITLEKLYYGSKGFGSYLLLNPKSNKTPFKLNGVDVNIPNSLGQALIATEYGSSKDFVQLDSKVKIIQTIIKPPIAARGIRSVGSAALSMCLVAEGTIDVYYEAGVHAWDVCAGVIIVKEAGGICENWNQKSFYDVLNRDVICIRSQADGDNQGQASLIRQLRSCLVDIKYERD